MLNIVLFQIHNGNLFYLIMEWDNHVLKFKIEYLQLCFLNNNDLRTIERIVRFKHFYR